MSSNDEKIKLLNEVLEWAKNTRIIRCSRCNKLLTERYLPTHIKRKHLQTWEKKIDTDTYSFAEHYDEL